MRELLTIGEAADAVGLTRTTLRHYDDIGLAVPAARRGGQRRYDVRDLRRLRVVTDLRRGGFRLDEIRQLLDGDGDWQPLARRKRRELAERIDQLVAAAELVDAALACGCDDVEGCAAADEDPPAPRHGRPGLTDPTHRLVGPSDDA